MKLAFFLFFVVLGIVYADVNTLPQVKGPDAEKKILKSSFDLEPPGAYNYGFETENQITREEVGELKELPGDEGPVVVMKGSYSYVDPEGNKVLVSYIADENGYRILPNP